MNTLEKNYSNCKNKINKFDLDSQISLGLALMLVTCYNLLESFFEVRNDFDKESMGLKIQENLREVN